MILYEDYTNFYTNLTIKFKNKISEFQTIIKLKWYVFEINQNLYQNIFIYSKTLKIIFISSAL